MAREYVKNLDAVKQINNQLKEQQDMVENLTGSTADLAASVLEVAEGHAESTKYSKENLDLANKSSKIASNVLGVIKAQEKGNKGAILLAKARLKLSTLFVKKNDDASKQLVKQYKLIKKLTNLKNKKLLVLDK